MDAVLTFGELCSAELLAGRLRRIGVAARCLDPREVLLTEERSGGARPDLEETRRRAGLSLRPVLDAAQVAVLGGFLGSSPSGATTHLGRGGSDLSASVLAAAMDAERVEIWTDVSGMMSADPRIVPEARTLPRIAFSEATVLARFGARVLHPDTIAPAVRAGIPVVIRNSFRPTDPGTVIEADGPAIGGLRALACRAPVGLVRLRRSDPLAAASLAREALSRIEERGLRPGLMAISEATLVLLVDQADLQAAREALTAMGEVEVVPDLGVVCAVGAGNLASEVMSRLAGERILMSWGGAEGPEVTVVVAAGRTHDLMRVLHRDLIEAVSCEAAGG
jgi:aspartate kinase